jgi:S-adenosylmethionine hydrolase
VIDSADVADCIVQRKPRVSAMPPLISLLTDFGGSDTYVGQMKGAILSVCSDARLVDLTHEIPAGDIRAGAIAWADAVKVFPPGTVHLAVVDPGVGSARRAVAAEIGPWKFVCPDNGLATLLLQRYPLQRAAELNCARWWRSRVSAVFHGRDIFGPVAGHWACGRDLAELGSLIEGPLVSLDIEQPLVEPHRVTGRVQSIDRFGNLVTNISHELLAGPLARWNVRIGSERIEGLSRYYGEQPPGRLTALVGSHGRLEVAVAQGCAAAVLKATVGTPVIVERA